MQHTAEFPVVAAPPGAGTGRFVAALILPATAAALLLVTAYVPSSAGDATSARAATITSFERRPSHDGVFAAEVVSASSPVAGAVQEWTVLVTDAAQRPVADAQLHVETWMPETGVRAPEAAAVSALGNGRYRIDGLNFARPGWWNVAVVISAAGRADSLAFNVVLPARTPPSFRARGP